MDFCAVNLVAEDVGNATPDSVRPWRDTGMDLGERLRSWFIRARFNFFPCFRRTGARIIEASLDERHIRIKLPLNWHTRGYFGTTFGGSIYAAIIPSTWSC